MKLKTLRVKVDPSTHRWLAALAQANSKSQLNPKEVKPEHLLAEAAFCLADAAGRHHGWRADIGGSLLQANNYGEKIPFDKMMALQTEDRRPA